MQVLKDIYQVGGSLNGVTWCGNYGSYDDGNVYIVKTAEGLLMFDNGNGETFEQIVRNMKYWNLNINDVKACFITHSHYDHAGASYKLNQLGIKQYAHSSTVEAVKLGDERCCGFLYHKVFTPAQIDVGLKNSDTISVCGLDITAIHCPGHTKGCTAFSFNLDGKSIVVSGDIIGTLLDGYHGWNGSFDFDKNLYLQSLTKFAKYDFDVMLPGHGMIYLVKPKNRIEEALNMGLIQWR